MVRAFVAIELPELIELALADQIEALNSRIDGEMVRWVRPSGVHLTLKFLGDVSAETITAVTRVVSEETGKHPRFVFEIAGLGCFPNHRRPRVIWLGVREPRGLLSGLQVGLEQSLASIGFKPEQRPFHAHLTLGRVKRGFRGGSIHHLAEALREAEVGSLGTVEAIGVSLMQSDLHPSGAVYSQLHFAPLGEGS